MNLLLDTHIVLWCLSSPDRLRPEVRLAVEDPANVVFVSAVSVWEMEIKRALGKLQYPDDLEERLKALRFTDMALRARHVRELRQLPSIHRDPFDRTPVSQALADACTLVTADRTLAAYPVNTLVA